MANDLVFFLAQTQTNDLLFDPAPPIGTSIRSTAFGTASHARGQLVGVSVTANFGTPSTKPIAIGSSLAVFGQPYGVFDQVSVAAGTQLTKFGLAHPSLVQQAHGSMLPIFGVVAGRQYWKVKPWARQTKISGAFYAFSATYLVAGGQFSRFGTPLSMGVIPGGGDICSAFGFSPTEFGQHTASYLLTGQASGIPPAIHGQHGTAFAYRHTSMAGGAFGAPFSSRAQRAAGLGAAAFGLPGHIGAYRATALRLSPHFGLHLAVRSNTFLAYGLNASGRIGHPTGFTRNNKPAQGLYGTHFGAPASRERSRVLHIPPSAAFGKPTLKRSAQC